MTEYLTKHFQNMSVCIEGYNGVFVLFCGFFFFSFLFCMKFIYIIHVEVCCVGLFATQKAYMYFQEYIGHILEQCLKIHVV